MKAALGFEGQLAKAAEKIIPVLLAVETLVMLSSITAPVTFTITPEGMCQDTDIYVIEEIFLAVTAVLTTILLFESQNHFSQKAAALTFVILPILEYVILGGSFADAAQYGAILTSMIIVYCVIFNAKSRKLASTQKVPELRDPA